MTDRIRKDWHRWEEEVVNLLLKKNPERKAEFVTLSLFPLYRLYTPEHETARGALFLTLLFF